MFLKVLISVLAIAGVAAFVAKATSKRKVIAGASAATLSALLGLMTLQVVHAQVFEVVNFPPIREVAMFAVAFFVFGALVAWSAERWWHT